MQMYASVRLFLLNIPFGETEIGMIKFSTRATLLVSSIPVDTLENQKILLDKIPNDTEQSTCIGCGIQEAIAVS